MRSIESFSGDSVVVGCSHHCHKKNHESVEDFYTIDINEKIDPDMFADFSMPLREGLKSRFNFCILEHLPYFIYNSSKPKDGSSTGFQNAIDILNENGFLIIIGCPRLIEFRRSLISGGFKYIEITDSDIMLCKNQSLTPQDIQRQIYNSPHIDQLITKLRSLKKIPDNTWQVCEIPLENIDPMRKPLAIEYRRMDELHAYQSEFNSLLKIMKIKIDELNQKGNKSDPNYDSSYIDVKEAANTMYLRLDAASNQFFNVSTKNLEDYKRFLIEFDQAIRDARPVIKQHRGTWGSLHPILKKLLGVLLTIIPIAPLLAITGLLKHGYKNTFFNTPKTDTDEKLSVFEIKARNVLSDIEISCNN